MDFIVTSSDIKDNLGAQNLFKHLRVIATGRNGYCYYKYPVAGGFAAHLPDIVIVDLEYGITVCDVYSDLKIEDFDKVEEEDWVVKGESRDPFLLKLEDYETSLKSRFDKYRQLRGKIQINYFLIFPQIVEKDFYKKFSDYDISNFKFSKYLETSYISFFPKKSGLQDKTLMKLFRSVSQGAGRLNEHKRIIDNIKSEKIGEAIKLIDTKISHLDLQQHAAAIQIPDGPQRIRGMAGSGKTIILTMKAAFLHSRFPDAKILYAFNTQSLYNQIKNWITKFYRETEEKDPDWNNMMIMHSWGTKSKEGVYLRACLRNSIPFIDLKEARSHIPKSI